MKRRLAVGVLLGLMVLGFGVGASVGYGGDCGCGPVAPTSCDTCCEPCGDPCGAPCSPLCNPLQIPLKVLDWVAHLGCCCRCNDGCGPRYWGECSEPVDCCDPCDCCGNWTGRVGPGRVGPGCAGPGYAKSAPRGPVYAQRSAPGRQAAYAQRSSSNHDVVKTEFGLDPSVQILSRTEQVVVPAGASTTVANGTTVRSSTVSRSGQQPHRAPLR